MAPPESIDLRGKDVYRLASVSLGTLPDGAGKAIVLTGQPGKSTEDREEEAVHLVVPMQPHGRNLLAFLQGQLRETGL